MLNSIPTEKKRIAVAMSGGVDSSVTAHILSEMGHELVGFTAWTLNGPGKCCNDALVNAGRVCEELGIPYDTVDLRAEFSHFVMDYYNNSYEAGLTPNPCVECNRYVKWDKLVDYAVKELDVDYVATGHYAQIDRTGDFPRVFRSVDERKDQTYMMVRVYPKDIERALFPLGHMTKPEVVKTAREIGLPEAFSKESQDICFVLDGQANYMKQTFGIRKGPIVDIDTDKVLGEHDGHFNYTIGQRRGVGVGAGRPVYVIKTDIHSNTVYVGDKHHIEATEFTVREPHWLHESYGVLSRFPLRSMIKIRYNTPPTMGTIIPIDDELKVVLDEPIVAITSGQIAAFYDEAFSELWGGGFIGAHLTHEPFDPDSKKELPNLFCEPAVQ